MCFTSTHSPLHFSTSSDLNFLNQSNVLCLSDSWGEYKWMDDVQNAAASMETVSEENHQRGSFAETKITGCHDSTLLQLGKKSSNYQAKKTNKTTKKPNFTRPSQPQRGQSSNFGSDKHVRGRRSGVLPPIPHPASAGGHHSPRGCLCSVSCSSTRNKLEYFTERINSSLSGGKRVFPHLCPFM